jgi:serine protease Do
MAVLVDFLKVAFEEVKMKLHGIQWVGKNAWASLVRVLAFGVMASVISMGSVANAQGRSLPDFTELVEQVGPSVVNIRTIERLAARPGQDGGPDEDVQELLRRFFGDRIPQIPKSTPKPKSPKSEDELPRGVGSGFILSADGLIMTNAHVVEGADEMLVTLTDKREFKAKLIGADRRSDIAVLKIAATGLPAVKIGDSGKLKVGEWVMAIGSPFGLENTVTAGIVSAKQRDTGDLLPLIQTDVAINPGNSGGPLINLRGEVVGVNSQIYSRSGGFMGISFSIPIDEAIRVGDQLRSGGRVVRGKIGVEIERLTKDQAEALGLGKVQGALVRGVQSGSPAEQAGIQAGDVIVKFDGKVVDKSAELPRFVGATKPGTKTTVTVFRKGATKDLSITVAELDADKSAAAAPALKGTDKPKPAASSASALGLTVSDLTPAQRLELKIKIGGVRVDNASGQAQKAGLKEGDIILSVGPYEVASVKDLEGVLVKIDKSKPVYLQFLRDEWTRYTLIRP